MTEINERIAKLSPEKRALLELHLMGKGTSVAKRQEIPQRGRPGPYPLSFAQQRLWFLDQLEPDSPAYNIPMAIRFSGALDAGALEQSLNEIVRRHEVLRTTFSVVDEQPVQIIAPTLSLTLPVVNLGGFPEAEREAQAMRLATEEAQRLFDLTQGSLLRTTLLRLGEEHHILLLTMHHIVSDGWSRGIFIRELSVLYEAFSTGKPSPLPELPIQYADFAVWQREWLQGEVLETQLSYWKQQLTGSPSLLNLPTDRPRPAIQTYRGARQSVTLPKSLTKAVKSLSQQEKVTLFMTLLAAFKVLLYRYTGEEDILVGTPIANRNRVEIEDLIGFFVNTLVLRSNLSGEIAFRELLGRVREAALDAYTHQDLPFEKLVAELRLERNQSYSPLFQVMFVLQNVPRGALELSGLTVSRMRVDSGTAKFDLALSIAEEAEGLRAVFEYNTDLFDATTIERMMGHYQTLLEGIITDPDRRISFLPLLMEAERHQMLVEWNDTQADYPRDSCVHQLFEAQAERTPDAVAVVLEDRQLTYRELNIRANQLAHYLQALGVEPEVLVGICVERSLEMVVGILGVLKAGGAYLPIDPSYPGERLAFMLEDAQVRALLTQERLIARFPLLETQIVCLDTGWNNIIRQREDIPSSGVTPENLAYVIYTSGSTGRPKGVMIEHQAICDRLHWAQTYLPLTTEGRLLQRASFCFDVSVREIFWPLMVGARLIMLPPDRHHDISYIVKLIAKFQITAIRFEPSLLHLFLDESGLDTCTCLKSVICSGEALSYELQDRFFARLDVPLHNIYGPTETTITATAWICKREGHHRIVAIGRPITNTQIYLLNRDLQPVPVGVPGELHIGGVGLARGYHNRPELTAEKFIPNPFSDEQGARIYKTGDLARYLRDGNIEFLGRLDHQVKIRGFRIELGEIETVMEQHPAVREVVVLAREDEPGDKRLVAYVVPNEAPSPTVSELRPQELRHFLKQKLPDYMVPSIFVMLDTLPLTPNGKVDRRALPAPDRTRPDLEEAFVAPRTPMESLVAEVWQEALGVDQVGVYDNFFDLGGHSLLAMQVIAKLEKELGLRFHPRDLIFQTLGQLASTGEERMSLLQPSQPTGFVQKVWNAIKKTISQKAVDRT